jgi:hypothetical protein
MAEKLGNKTLRHASNANCICASRVSEELAIALWSYLSVKLMMGSCHFLKGVGVKPDRALRREIGYESNLKYRGV